MVFCWREHDRDRLRWLHARISTTRTNFLRSTYVNDRVQAPPHRSVPARRRQHFAARAPSDAPQRRSARAREPRGRSTEIARVATAIPIKSSHSVMLSTRHDTGLSPEEGLRGHTRWARKRMTRPTASTRSYDPQAKSANAPTAHRNDSGAPLAGRMCPGYAPLRPLRKPVSSFLLRLAARFSFSVC